MRYTCNERMSFLLSTRYSLLSSRKSQAVMSLVFLIGAIIVIAGLTLAFVMISFMNSTIGLQASHRALFAAAAGVHDALLMLARNKDFSPPQAYAVPFGAYAASVTVAQNAPSMGLVTITSDAVVSSRERKIQAIAAVDSYTGDVTLVSFKELVL